MMRTRGCSRYGKKGQMPLAFIAVALLIAGAFYGIVYADIEKGTENAESTIAEFSSIDDEIERARITIESALGEIVTEISRADGGTLLNRSDEFRRLTDAMLAEKFPTSCKGVRTEVADSSIRLGMETMRLTESEVLGGVTSASYLTASGTVDLVFTSESAVSRKTLDISADATSALPLIAEASTRFELSTQGSGTALSQMIEYQLSALASQRVINGYGMFSGAGNFGTSGILTVSDVEKAVRNGLDILEAMFFRDCGNDTLLTHAYADLADMITVSDGCLVIDLGSLYSQALMQKADEYAVQWIEYIGADWIADIVDIAYDCIKKVIDWIWNRVDSDHTKKEAVNYIKSQMSNMGYDVSDYRYFMNGQSMEFWVGDIHYTEKNDDDSDVRTIPGAVYEIPYPEVDVLDWDGWSGFMEYYRSQVNEVRQMITDAIKAIAANAAGGAVIRVPVSAFDTETFADEMNRLINDAVNGSMDSFIDSSAETVKRCRISDPVMAEAYRTICRNSDEIFRVDDFRDTFDDLARLIAFNEKSYWFFTIEDSVRSQIDCDAAVSAYKAMVAQRLEYLSIFNDATKTQTLSHGLASTVGSFLRQLNLQEKVAGTATGLCSEMMRIVSINPYSRPAELPGSDRFTLSDGNGSISTEKLYVSDSTDLSIGVTDPIHNKSKNTHYIGLLQNRVAKYSSVFTVRIAGSVCYSVNGCDPVHEALGLFDCSYTGTVSVDMELDIACASAFPLAQTEYTKSNTAYGDAGELVGKFIADALSGLIDPLIEVLSAIESLNNVASTVIVEFSNQLNRMMEMYYEIISVPMDFLQEAADALVQDVFRGLGIEDLCIKLGSQTIVLNVFGYTVTIETNLRSLQKTSKEFFTVSSEKYVGDGTTVRASVSFRENTRVGQYVLLSGGATGGDWDVSLTLDPMLSGGSYYASVSGHVRNVEYSGNLPELVQYQTVDFSTSDVPALGELLSNIALPAVGFKGALELGMYVKYNRPIELGLLINEVELNPEGNDSGKEWIELFNNTDGEIDLLGYTVVPSDSDKKAYSIGDVTIPAHGKTVIRFKGQVLNNGSSGSGIRLSLYDTYGNLVDRTPSMKDSENNGYTWQRVTDGAVNWSFMPGTEDGPNNSSFPGGFLMKTAIIEFAKDAAVEVLDEMGDSVDGTDEFIEYAERVMARVTEKFIDSIAGSLVEACVYVKFEMTDYAETQHYGVKVMLGVDSDIVGDTLRYLASMIPTIGEYIACPEGITAEKIAMKDIYLRTLTYAGKSLPKILRGDITETDVGISVKVNLSGFSALFGDENSDWSAEAGIVLEDVPTASLPASLKAEKYMKSDLWLFRMTFRERCN